MRYVFSSRLARTNTALTDERTLSSPCSVLTRALEVSLARCVSLLSVQLQNNKLRPLRS